MGDSLIQRDQAQGELLTSAQMTDCLFAGQEQALVGEFTGERLFARKPEIYRAIVSLTAEGLGIIRIGKLLSVSPNTVQAVRKREGLPIDMVKKELADLAHAGAALALEGVLEDLSDPVKRGKIGTRDKAVVAAVLVDKGQLLSGEATSRLEVSDIRTPDHDDFNRYVAGLRSAVPQTGLGGENPAQKGAPGMPGGIAGTEGSAGTVDSESEGKASNEQ